MLPAPGGPPTHFLHPCTLFVHAQEHVVTTLLGSCVTVTLHEPQLRLGGMNHFMLPLWNGVGLPTPRFGNIAMEKLIERMVALGARPERLVARIYGGASILLEAGGSFGVGERNIQVARELLSRHRIFIQAAEVGGSTGLRLRFNTASGEVECLRMESPQVIYGALRKEPK